MFDHWKSPSRRLWIHGIHGSIEGVFDVSCMFSCKYGGNGHLV